MRKGVLVDLIPTIIFSAFVWVTFYPMQVSMIGHILAVFNVSLLGVVVLNTLSAPVIIASYAIVRQVGRNEGFIVYKVIMLKSLQSLGCTCLCLDKFKLALKSNSFSKEDAITTGRKLHTMLKTMNNAIGGLLFLEFTVIVVSLSFSLFFGILVFAAVE